MVEGALRQEPRGLFLADPRVPENPAEHGEGARPADDGDGGDTLLNDANEAADEDGDGADVLHDDGGIGDEWPEVVRKETGVALEGGEEGGRIGVIIWI
jgi:hypothetical protein